MKNKKIILIGIGIITLLLVVGVSFAIFSFSKYGNNQQLVLGDIYMHYNETNQLRIDNEVPTNTYDPDKYFEFTIDGKNTYSKKDIYFDIVLSHGDNHETRNTRIDDKFLMFRLVEVVDGEENVIINKISLAGILDNRIYVNTIPKNTLTQINKKYRLYMWIDDSVRIGKVGANSTTQIDYDFDTWNNDVFASIKVNVSGDFIEKTIDFSKLFRGILNAKDSTTIIDDDGTIYLSGPNEVTSSGGESSGEATDEASKESSSEASKEATSEASNESSGESTENTQDAVDYNYVWYSGKLWRITAVYPDGTMKMVTDDVITTISYGSDVNFYTNNENSSYIYQWLNEDFLDTLYNYENIIVTDSKWNSLTTTSISTKITEGTEGVTTTISPVGLLNSYEYYMNNKNTSYSNGYLNIGYNWWLLNPYGTSDVWYVSSSGFGDNYGPTNTYGGRPSINLKSGIQLSGGSGTKNDPYMILGDKEEVTAGTTLLNTRSSGEYVKFNNELYRIVNIENNIIKINKNDYVRDTSDTVLTKKFSTNVTYGGGTSDVYWDYYLNNTWYNSLDASYQNMIVESTYYTGTVPNSPRNYKASICATASNTVTTKDCEKTTSTWAGLVGLPRYGEMFASQQGSEYSSSSTMWLMNSYSTLRVWIVNDIGNGGVQDPIGAPTYAVRPSINLKSNIKIIGGNGTKYDPFEISE